LFLTNPQAQKHTNLSLRPQNLEKLEEIEKIYEEEGSREGKIH
jgi:hypothetical protein